MLIPKKDRLAIYSRLFQDGVMVAKKNYNGKHHYMDCKNIWVWHALRSLDARGYVKTQFNWQVYYWFLTNEGIEYLRAYLHLPDDIIPNTLKKGRGGEDRERDARGGDRDGGDRPRRDGDRPPRRDGGDRDGDRRPGGRGRGGFGGDRERREGGGERREGGGERREGGRGFGGGDKKAGAPRSGDIGFKGEGGRGRGAAPAPKQ